MLIDITIVPTFFRHASPPKAALTLRGIDATSTTVRALGEKVYAHLTARSVESMMKASRRTSDSNTDAALSTHSPGDVKEKDIAMIVDGIDLCLTAGGVTLMSSDATTVLPNRTSRPRPPSRPLLTLHVTEKPEPYLIKLNLIVLETKAALIVEMPPTATIGDLRRMCVVDAGIPDENLMVLPTRLRQNEFDDAELTLAQCAIQNDAVLYLDDRSRPRTAPCRLLVKTITGRCIEVCLPLDVLVDDLKAALVPATGLEPDAMRLLFAGRPLEEGRSLQDYGLNAEATIHWIQRLRGNGQCDIPPTDTVLLRMSFSMDALPERNAVVVKVVDTIGSIPFVQKKGVVTLARPCLGLPHVWCVSRGSADAVRMQVRTFQSATLRIHQLRTAVDDGVVGHKVDPNATIKEEQLDLNFKDCHTGTEFLQTLFTQVAQKLPFPIKERGFDLHIVRPSGAEVLLDGVAPLLSPLNARKRLIVRPVAEGTQPAFAYDRQDDVSSSDSSSDEELPV